MPNSVFSRLFRLSDKSLGPITVGHDLDGCYFSFTGAFCVHLAQKYPEQAEMYLSQMMPTTHTFFEEFGWDVARFVDEYDEAMASGLLAQAEFTFPGSVQALDRLGETFGRRLRNVIITYRDNGATQFEAPAQTAQWALEVGFPFTALIASKDKTVFDCDYFIEDSVPNYHALRAKGVNCFLMSRPWNAGADVPSEHIVASIDEFVDRVILSELAQLPGSVAA